MKKNRYPGVKPFETDERDRFFGRGRDIRDLYDLILLEKLVVVFGKSGYGKSSLLNAGIIPKFLEEPDEESRFTPLVVRLGAYVEGASLLPAGNLLQRLEEKFPYTGGAEFLDGLQEEQTLWYEFKRRQATGHRRFVLILDQFEEFFSYPPEARQRFKEQLAELLYQDSPQAVREQGRELTREQRQLLATPLDIKAVFAIREDRLSLLDSMKDKLPAILHKRYELRALSREQAREAIVRPAGLKGAEYASPPFGYSSEVLERILDELSRTQQAQQHKIEAFQLQFLCQHLESKVIERGEAGITIRPSDLPDQANLFGAYYHRQIQRLPEGQRLAARRLIEDGLILEDPATGEGRRVGVDGQLLVKQFQEYGATPELLKALEDAFLLRREASTLGGYNYEISHDTLLGPIQKARAEWKEEEARKARELEKEKIRKARQQQQRAWWLIGLGAVFAVGLIFYAVNQTVKAEQNRKEAEQNREEAEQNREEAEQIRQNLERKIEFTKELKAAANDLLSMAQKDGLPSADSLAGLYKNLPSSFIDPRDSRIYETVEINDKIWMADNLNYDAGEGSWVYEDDPKNGRKYGRLYTWEATRRACPPGLRRELSRTLAPADG